MLDKSFGLLFYLKKPKNYLKGEVPIYLRITVDGIPKELSVKRCCDPSRWNPHAGRASGTKENVKTLNNYLDTYQAKVFEAKRRLVEGNQMVTAAAIKDILMGVDQRNKMLIKIFEDYNADVKKLVGIHYSNSTWTKYDRTRRLTQEFILWKYKTEDIHIKQLDFEFVNQCELWYKTIRKCGHNTTLKYISILKMIIHYCMDNLWLDHDPFARFEMTKEDVHPTFLTKEEIQCIADKEITIERLRRIRDVYLFCCFTGLAAAVTKFPITELGDTEKAKALMQSLQKGNIQSVSIEKDGNVSKMFIEANPQFKTVTVYDANLKRIQKEDLGIYQVVQQSQGKEMKQEQMADLKQDNKKDVKQKVGDDLAGPKKKTSRKKGMSV